MGEARKTARAPRRARRTKPRLAPMDDGNAQIGVVPNGPSIRAREAAFYRLQQLYGVGGDDPIWRTLQGLWNHEIGGRPLLALLTALARDPMLRDGAPAVLDASPGERIRWPAIAATFEAANPGQLGGKMAKSLAQNAASSWTQAAAARARGEVRFLARRHEMAPKALVRLRATFSLREKG
jgi:hypothetical protein